MKKEESLLSLLLRGLRTTPPRDWLTLLLIWSLLAVWALISVAAWEGGWPW